MHTALLADTQRTAHEEQARGAAAPREALLFVYCDLGQRVYSALEGGDMPAPWIEVM